MRGSPAGPAVRVACTDADREWYLDLTRAGQRTVHAEPIDVAQTLCGGAGALLLWLYGRLDTESASVTVAGDRTVLARWRELIPAG